MSKLSLVILYVDSLSASAALYCELLHQEPMEASPTFTIFRLPSGIGLGLWSRHTVQPAAAAAGGSELAFLTADVDAMYADWTHAG